MHRTNWLIRLGLRIAGFVIFAIAVGWALWVHHLPQSQRDSASGEGQFWLALAGFVLIILGGLNRFGTPGSARSVERLSDLLATAMQRQWERAANDRKLLTPAPIPITWSLSDYQTAPLVAAVSAAGLRPAHDPLPGLKPVTEQMLRSGGGQPQIHDLYGGLASGRLVIEGGPGAGKSAAGILLLLDALKHRASLRPDKRHRIPVPVIFTLTGWDASARRFDDWLIGKLSSEVPFLAGRRGQVEAAALVQAGLITVVLDGLDEVPPNMRHVALDALSSTQARVVLLTRTAELIDAATRRHFVDAAVIHLERINPSVAADYLDRCLAGPNPVGWDDLLRQLRSHTDGPLAQGLSSPLELILLRDTYNPGDSVEALLDPALDPLALQSYLLGRVIPAAYRPVLGEPPPRYKESHAWETFTEFAKTMNASQTRDLAWWDIPEPVFGCVTSLLAPSLLGGLGMGIYGILGYPAYGIENFPPSGSSLIKVFGNFFLFGAVVGYLVLMLVGLPGVFIGLVTIGEKPNRLRRLRVGDILLLALAITGIVASFFLYSHVPAIGAFSILLMIVLLIWLGRALGRSHDDTDPIGPRELWRSDLIYGIIVTVSSFLAVILVVGLLYGIRGVHWPGASAVAVTIWIGLIFALPAGFLLGPVRTAVWWECLFAIRLHFKHGTPLRLVGFLEDARNRGVLRTVGPVYQFKHAALQDFLAARDAGPVPEPGKLRR